MIKFKTILLVVSLLLNALFVWVVTNALSGETRSLSFYAPEPSMTAAVVASVPPESGSIVFNVVEFTLKRGESASLQFSGLVEGKQANWIVESLYDHRVIHVRKSVYGIIITALEIGETVMQSVTGEGIQDIAFVKVIE